MTSSTPHSAFNSSGAVAKYAEGPKRNVPGYSGILPMTRILLGERVPAQGRVLVVGAGGGLEMEDLALANPEWTIDGVDPSGPMLELAASRLGPLMSRMALHEGYVQDAPDGPFDGATCLLTFHFVPPEQRLPTAKEIHRRLKPGAPFVVAHLSVEDGAGERDMWMKRYAAFLVSSGSEPRQAAATREKVEKELTILSPSQDEAILREAGFSDVRLFYVGFTFRGWVAYA
ncbi:MULTISPECIES: class I SAM-dependent methyltransferase [Variovorax]|jgi:tRNA (cmo5U34)-methyltransferase|uniref:class I SAM-dependent methyltransferase n=1 Tax=Variovorax TaxID=34072 RepID=UPI0008698415|nr:MULTISPECIES: class I SAM-dependent methyltransferase [Variovorax]MBN8757516.1 class I SAM-dependent methyltransferase [Variovorax sp.]ODU13645.1 MAG: methyltransferase [Variovorax sp. SCN 67-85]ODV20947.1 MAG: methyltransferase [Variovorax sp. SCN 67-20]OJZ08136.1 MAG: methyltransferase [Variovorax sp. 67-131]UKI05647.1 class I SAM-dependent methyltransferase [Variovorax paradoxus]